MSRRTFTCKYCNKIGEVAVESRIGDYISRRLDCGHSFLEKLAVSQTPDLPTDSAPPLTKLQAALFPYQKEGREFIEKSNFRCILADDMGLGKCIQALAALERSSFKRYLVIVKSSLACNWFMEINRWMRPDFPRPIIHTSKDRPIAGFPGYIISMDCLSSIAVREFIKYFNPEIVIIDEAHNFKNGQTKRTQALNESLAGVDKIVMLTGTPLMSRLSEYWTILNIVRPDHWPSLTRFLQNYVEWSSVAKKYLGILSWKRDDFKFKTSSYVLRRTKNEVAIDLPEFFDCYEYCSDINKQLKMRYDSTLQELENAMMSKRGSGSMDIMVILQRLWGIAGLAKVPYVAEQAIEFLENSEPDRKLCIGVHHKDVTLYLKTLLSSAGYTPIVIDGSDDSFRKQDKENRFRAGEARVCIMSILAGGEGRNMQFCDTAMLAEQYWVPAKIEQFKGRFHRIGSTSEHVSMTAYYLKDSIDEYFQELLELKKGIVGTAVTTDWDVATDNEAIMSLATKLVKTRRKFAA